GREQLLHSDRVPGRSFAPTIGFTDDLSHFQTAPRHKTESRGPMIAPRTVALLPGFGTPTRGARPISPHATTRTSFASPRSYKSVTSAERARSKGGNCSRSRGKLLSCVSQLLRFDGDSPLLTQPPQRVTIFAPASTNRRARKKC